MMRRVVNLKLIGISVWVLTTLSRVSPPETGDVLFDLHKVVFVGPRVPVLVLEVENVPVEMYICQKGHSAKVTRTTFKRPEKHLAQVCSAVLKVS